jgi:hypothetical protein
VVWINKSAPPLRAVSGRATLEIEIGATFYQTLDDRDSFTHHAS